MYLKKLAHKIVAPERCIAILCLLVIILAISCKTSTFTGSKTPFAKVDEKGIKWGKYLELTEDHKYTYFADTPYENVYWCCDLISSGTWKLSENHKQLLLTSSPLDENPLKLIVEEQEHASSDSIQFSIENPIEVEVMKDNDHRVPILSYDVYSTGTGMPQLLISINKKTFKIKRDANLKEIELVVKPTEDYFFRTLGKSYVNCKRYTIQDLKVSKLKIDIPDLTFQYISFLRLNDEQVTIKSSKHLLWYDAIFKKKNYKGKSKLSHQNSR